MIARSSSSASTHGDTAPGLAGTLMQTPMRDRDAMILGAVAVLFLHVLFFAAVPREVPRVVHVEMPKPEKIALRLLSPDEYEPKYLRANPLVDSSEVPDTLDYSDRDQVAAQEEVTPLSDDNMPAMQGDEADAIQVEQGDPFRTPPTPQSAARNPQQQQAVSPVPLQMPAPRRVAQITAPEAMEAESVDPEGMLALEDPAENPEVPDEPEKAEELQPVTVTSKLDGTGQAQNFTPPQQPSQSQAPNEPRERPRLAPDNARSPLRDSTMGVSRQGRVALNTRYSEFGEYWKRVREVIEKRWNNLVINSYDLITWDGERVQFEIVIHRDGSISDLRILHSGVSRVEETLARDAIESRAPFFEWTPEMIATMGDQTAISFGFIY